MSEGAPIPSARVLTIFQTKDGVSPLVSGLELLDAVPLGAILVVLSLHSWLRRAHLQPVASGSYSTAYVSMYYHDWCIPLKFVRILLLLLMMPALLKRLEKLSLIT